MLALHAVMGVREAYGVMIEMWFCQRPWVEMWSCNSDGLRCGMSMHVLKVGCSTSGLKFGGSHSS
jgi:hypothetical protein